MKTNKVKIIDSLYYPSKSLVIWKIHFVEDKNLSDMSIAWHKDDLSSLLLGDKVKITDEQMKKFCDDMNGKVINLVLESGRKVVGKDTSNLSFDEISSLADQLDSYPFHETQAFLEDEKGQK